MEAWKQNLEKDDKDGIKKYYNRIIRRRRLISLLTFFAILLVVILSGIYYFNRDNIHSSTFYYTTALIVGAVAVTSAMLKYLESNTYVGNSYTGTGRKTELSTLEAKIDFLALTLKNPSISEFKIDEDKIYRIVEEGLKVNIQESFIKTLEEKYSDIIIQEIHYKDISDEIIRSKNRILSEIGSLNKRGNLNLVIGSLTTIVAVGILFSSFFYSISVTKLDEILAHYLPRISIVFFAEIFAFFFLRLYRNSLIDIKYYQNELTNIESKGLSLKAAIFMKDKELYNNIIMEFCKTERNGILKNDESNSTIVLNKNESEKDKSYSDNIKSLTEVLEKFVPSNK